jgi:hypothetical protein
LAVCIGGASITFRFLATARGTTVHGRDRSFIISFDGINHTFAGIFIVSSV